MQESEARKVNTAPPTLFTSRKSAVSGASMAGSATPLGFRVFRVLDKNVVRDVIPGVMNADEEQ